MRPSTKLVQLALCLSTFASVSSAWSGLFPDIDSLVVRADDDSSSSASAEKTPSPTAKDDTASSTPTVTSSGKNAPKTTNLNTAGITKTSDNTAKETGTGKETATGKETGKDKTKSEEPTHTEFPPDSPPGGVSMTFPATTRIPTPLYRIGDNITLGWNYTSLLGTPTAIDVLVTNTLAGQETWTLTANMTFQTDVTFVWNSEKQAEDLAQPLPVALYTMIIKDSEAEVTEMPQPGYLGAYNQFSFGLYQPQPYTPFPQWQCPGSCSGAASLDTHALSFVLTMGVVTVLSFTWFVTGLGLH